MIHNTSHMKVKIDQETCIGCGSCVAVCSDVFDLDDEGKARLKNSEKPAEGRVESGCLKEAADICPVEAIILEDEK